MIKYHGQIKTQSEAKTLSKKLRETGNPTAIASADALDHNWHYIAARPSLQPELIALSESTMLSRKGGIMDKLINSKPNV